MHISRQTDLLPRRAVALETAICHYLNGQVNKDNYLKYFNIFLYNLVITNYSWAKMSQEQEGLCELRVYGEC